MSLKSKIFMDRSKNYEIVSMLVSATLADEILGELLETDANFIGDNDESLSEANALINKSDIVLIEKVSEENEEVWCFEDYNIIKHIEPDLALIDEDISDLVDYNKIYGDEIITISVDDYDNDYDDNDYDEYTYTDEELDEIF